MFIYSKFALSTEFSTNVYITPEQWGNKRKVVKSYAASDSQGEELQEQLDKLLRTSSFRN